METYETRIDVEEVGVNVEIGPEGEFSIELEIAESEEEEDDDDE